MAANKYLSQVSGVINEVIPATLGGSSYANQIPALSAAGLLDVSMMPVGIGPDVVTLTASEAIAAGALVNIWENAGVANVRNADCSAAGKEANGFVLTAVAASGQAMVYLGGPNTAVTGLTPGTLYFLNTVGSVATSPCGGTTGAGKVSQAVGRASAGGILCFQPGDPITLAS